MITKVKVEEIDICFNLNILYNYIFLSFYQPIFAPVKYFCNLFLDGNINFNISLIVFVTNRV